MFKEVLADLKISSMSARGSSNKVFGGPDPSTAEAEPIKDLCIDIWVSVIIICLSTQITERQGTAMYQRIGDIIIPREKAERPSSTSGLPVGVME